ncbi:MULTISPECIES: hypothetical protein [unclassified Nocardia]|uniref:hypothetical protein n=1 Tax=unclassified Nocardia TaxID=2637762 RepID=UPI001CE481E6|nr:MULTISPECIES: hypothetical protein [unclassified Nocardia]
MMRVAADHSWETPERTAGRLILTGLDDARLRAYGITPVRVSRNPDDHDILEIWFEIDDDYQVFVDIPWRDRSPEEIAHKACAILARPPQEWHARWHAIKYGLPAPEIAGSRWEEWKF